MTLVRTERTRTPLSLRPEWVILFAAAAIAVLTLVGIQALAAGKLPLVCGVILAPIVVYGLCRHPHFAAYFVLFLLYSNTPVVLAQFHGVPYSVALAVPGLLLIPIGYHLWARREELVFPTVSTWILAFVMVQALGAIFARDPDASIAWFARSVGESVVLFLLIVNAVRTPAALRGAIWAMVAAGAFMGAFTTHQYLTRSYDKDYGGFAQTQDTGFSTQSLRGKVRHARAIGPIGEKNRFAQIMLMLMPLGLFGGMAERAGRARFLLMMGFSLATAGCALTFSRGAVVALGLTVTIATGMGYLRPRQLLMLALGGLLLVALLPQYRTRMASLFAIDTLVSSRGNAVESLDGSIRGRATEMLAAARVFADHPIVGIGPGMFKYYARKYGLSGGYRALDGRRQAHNLYLGIAAEHGLLGLGCFMAIVLITLHNLHRVRGQCVRTHPQLALVATSFAISLLLYLVSGMFYIFRMYVIFGRCWQLPPQLIT